jgi:uncharacterized protein (TIRG00374 family)
MIEKAMDSIVISMLFALTLFTTPTLPIWVQRGALLPFGVALVLTGLITAILHRKGRALGRLAARRFLPTRAAQRISRMVGRLTDGLRIVPEPPALAAVFCLSVVLWLLPVLSSYVMIRAFGFDVSFAAPLCVFVLVSFGSALPQAPGMVGTYQYACVLALGFFGVPASDAFAYGLVLNTVQLSTLVIQGIAALCLGGLSLATPMPPTENVLGANA